MASVYLGRLSGPMGFQRPVAIKLMHPQLVQSEEFVKMFLDEARLVARLSHPNIVQLLELGEDTGPIGAAHGGFFIVMECLMGESLLDTWYACQDRRLMLPYDVVAWIGARAAEGLHHAHELKDPMTGASEGIVHRDVNPGNIFLTYDGQVKVIDFGVAKALNRLSSSTNIGTLKGKVAYMAPEQAKTSDVDRRADVFSLGVTLWELTTDRRLFKRRNDVDTLLAVCDAVVPDPTTGIPDYPRELWHVLQRALQKNRDDRFPTALDFSRELDRVAQSLGRSVDATVVAEVMNFLFYEQRNRYVEWLKHATAGESREVLRSVDPKRVEVASVDAVPLSARSGQMMPIRGSQPQPPISDDAPTIALQQPSPTGQFPGQTRVGVNMSSPRASGAGSGEFWKGLPPQQPVAFTAPSAPIAYPQPPPMAPPVAPTAPRKGSIASNVVFMVIAIGAVLAMAGFFVYVRFFLRPPPAPPQPVPTMTTSASTPAPPSVTTSAPVPSLEASVLPSASASASAEPSATAPRTTHRPLPPPSSTDDILRSRL